MALQHMPRAAVMHRSPARRAAGQRAKPEHRLLAHTGVADKLHAARGRNLLIAHAGRNLHSQRRHVRP